MVERVVGNYYKFFDETLQSTTFIVIMITILVFLVGIVAPRTHADFQTELHSAKGEKNIVIIDGSQYELQFKKID